MSQTEKKFTFGDMQHTLKVAYISQFSQIEGEFPSELLKPYDVSLCKIYKRMLPMGFL